MSVADRVRHVATPTAVGYRAVQLLYNRTVRQHLPTKYRLCAGVAVEDIPLFDATANMPEYKHGVLTGIRDAVDAGDTVCIVGGGYGISTIHTARCGAGQVIAYEAAPEMMEVFGKTLRENYYSECSVNLRHGLVGPDVHVYGDASGAPRVHPTELPECDLLVLDCEGAELEILRGMDEYPRRMVIETHDERGAPAEDVRAVLEDAGLGVEEREYEPSRDLEKPVFVCSAE